MVLEFDETISVFVGWGEVVGFGAREVVIHDDLVGVLVILFSFNIHQTIQTRG